MLSWFVLVAWLLAAQQWAVESVSISDRLGCKAGDAEPTGRVNTTQRLADFRNHMKTLTVDGKVVKAFIVYTQDAHNSEYPTEYDQRRAYISGFTGSAGTAVITETKAALWTDGRYFLEADTVLDCNWLLMKTGISGTPKIAEWLNSELATSEQVGVDKTLITSTAFTDLQKELSTLSRRLSLGFPPTNPVDATWTTDRPAQPKKPINALDIAFAGLSWQDKVKNLRANLTSKNAKAFVVTGLDEVAWLFNLRGSDISYNPFFLSYAIVEMNKVSLYILDHTNRLTATPTDAETKVTLAEHLNTSDTGACPTGATDCVTVLNYVLTDVDAAVRGIAFRDSVWVTFDANYAIYDAASANRIVDKSPVALDKSKKNSVERAGMQRAYNRDSAALIKFLAFLEKEIEAGRSWTEVSAGAELDKRRGNLQYSRGLSFETISGYGSNGAIIHYRTSSTTNKAISTDSLYLLDSGGQYIDGTTDVTRTMHYGTPTSYQKECYTRVLMGAINLAMLKWPAGLYGRQIDAVTRNALWEVGLDYRHGTGHGIGAFLSVHEGPGRISLVKDVKPSDEPLAENQFFSDEPGYYEDGAFGIRLETIVRIEPFTPKHTILNERFLGFETVTYVPFENKLIDYTLLTTKQVAWLNRYNSQIRSTMLPLLSGDQVAIDWVNARTETISDSATHNGAANQIVCPTSTILVVMASLLRLWA